MISLLKTTHRTVVNLDKKMCIMVNRLNGINFLDRLFCIISILGNGYIYVVGAALLILIEGKSFIPVYKDYVIASLINQVIYKLIKNKVKRERPFKTDKNINHLLPPPDEFSFPSGHAAAAAVFCICTFFHFPLYAGILTVIWLIAVGFSRVYNGVHYPGDVLMGTVLGVIIARMTLAVIY